MSVNIKNDETERLVRRLVASTGETVTRAVTVAVQERLDRIEQPDAAAADDRGARIRAIARDASHRWTEPYRSADHGDLLYDDAGLPPVIIDTSAIVAILRGEPDADRYVDALARSSAPRLSAGTYLETAIVVDANGDPVLSRRLDDLLATAAVDIVPVTRDQVEVARRAYRDFGKGSGHRAGLNLGDCFAYALASGAGEPLLYKGDDFTHTDVEPALGAR